MVVVPEFEVVTCAVCHRCFLRNYDPLLVRYRCHHYIHAAKTQGFELEYKTYKTINE